MKSEKFRKRSGDIYKKTILVIDDDIAFAESLKEYLENAGFYNTIIDVNGEKWENIKNPESVDLVLLDIMLDGKSGIEILPNIKKKFPRGDILICSGVSEIPYAVEAIKSGASGYIQKTSFANIVEQVETHLTLQIKDSEPPESPVSPVFRHIITQDPEMINLFRRIETFAVSSQPILIIGETGTGKDLISRAIHDASDNKGIFIVINAAGLDDPMFSDALFGHVKGAYTGAVDGRKGLIEQAAGGTLCLDEIGDLGNTSQIKILRLIEHGEYYPIGSDKLMKSTARIVVATNRDLRGMVEAGEFRQDLYFRLAIHELEVPPLRYRLHDIPLLVEHFLKIAAKEYGKPVPVVPGGLYDLLRKYSFPGNVREIRSMVFNAVSMQEDNTLPLKPIRRYIEKRSGLANNPNEAVSHFDDLPTLKEANHAIMLEALKRAKGNQTVAAQMLGITPSAMNKRIKRNGIDYPHDEGTNTEQN